ncbi:hypothetical protein PKB_2795 [Pseudomonas knackmussii B13]|uniref:Uncharacterized protein n=1 Tax=Pseudomonas knackmussii (strain DSM 6978 / CCUG 54928 / LMG 23759 / B13) TaxID=1301098 RepID=A0A024HI25_PSEKB|nr:hypothetical protein PKB_2795 [Pseudomonas knackmussii B13]
MRHKLAQHRLVAVQRIEQPEQRDVGHGEVGHTLVAFPAHPHQPCTLGGELDQQVVQLREQPRVGGEVEQRRHEGVVKAPTALPVPHQARDRAGQVLGVVIAVQAQGQDVLHHRHRLAVLAMQIGYVAPLLAIAHRSRRARLADQAIATVGLEQRQGQQQDDLLAWLGRQLRQVQRRRQRVDLVAVDQRAVGQAYAQLRGLDPVEAQGLQVECHGLDAPGVNLGQVGDAFVGPGLPARLLLELLGRQQGPGDPQGAVDLHDDFLASDQAFALGICETSDRFTSMPSTWKCGTA